MTKQLFLISFIALFSSICLAQTANYWTPKSDFGGLKRERACAFTIGDKAYVGTGVDTAEIVHKDFWSFDPDADVWTQIADLPGSVRRNAVAFTVQGFGYVGTGMDSVEATAPGANSLNDFWKYNSMTNTWTSVAPYPGASGMGVYFATGFAIDSKGYVCGGKQGPNWYSNQLWEYKPTLNQWTQLANFPGGVRYQLASFTIDYKAYVGLGADQDMYRDDMWAFDATTNQWSTSAPLPASERGAAMTFSIGQRGYVCMGTNGGVLDDLWEYNPFENNWESRATYGGTKRKGGVGFSINGLGYVGTGDGNSGKKASFHEYHPPLVVGLDENQIDISLYPNPVQNELHLSSNSTDISTIEVVDQIGRVVITKNYSKSIDISSLPRGHYLLVAKASNAQILSQKRFLKI